MAHQCSRSLYPDEMNESVESVDGVLSRGPVGAIAAKIGGKTTGKVPGHRVTTINSRTCYKLVS